MSFPLLSTHELWAEIDSDSDPTTWPWGLEQASQTICTMYPGDAARMQDQQFESYAEYRDKPIAYIREILKIEPTPKQEEIANALLADPYKVIVVSCNNYGKSHLAGGLVNWFYDSFDPGICITTAPRLQDVQEVLWKEVRMQRRTRSDFRGDMVPKLYAHAGHYAEGYTGNTVTAFHGRHDDRMFFILDEATGIKSFVWTGIKSMFKKTGRHHFLALLNPTDTTSPAYAEAQSGAYKVIRLSALEHPNVLAELRGEDAAIPQAVDTVQLAEWFADPMMFEEIHSDDYQTGDVMWPPPWSYPYGSLARFGREGRSVCYRPGPEGQSRVLGLWPTATPGAIWSDLAWQAACRELEGWKPLPVRWVRSPEIGCDVARGTSERSDKTSIIVQIEGVVIAHRYGGGWDTIKTANECIELANEWARVYNSRRDERKTQFLHPQQIPIKVDDGGLGGGVVDILKARQYCVIGINAATSAKDPARYPIMRDQLWFAVPLAAVRGEIDLSRLSAKSKGMLRNQCMGVQWKHDFHGRRKVEKKDDTKKRIGRSPDDADALNLAFAAVPTPSGAVPQVFSHYQGPVPSMGPPAEPTGPLGG